MKLIRFGAPGRERPGVQLADGTRRDVSALRRATTTRRSSAASGLERLRDWLDAPGRAPAWTPRPRLGPPIARPSKIVCIGLNFRDHAAETGAEIPAGARHLLQGHHRAVRARRRRWSSRAARTKVDWEVELAVVIGAARALRRRASEAARHVAGYALHNDYSERSFQLERGGQWSKGKSADTFAPLGPFLATPDEIPDPQRLGMWLTVNGEVRQQSTTANMVFDVPTLVSYLSQFMTLLPGDVISTGTPAGVGLGMKPEPVYLQAGDVVELGIDGLGESRQRVVGLRDEAPRAHPRPQGDPAAPRRTGAHHAPVWPEVAAQPARGRRARPWRSTALGRRLVDGAGDRRRLRPRGRLRPARRLRSALRGVGGADEDVPAAAAGRAPGRAVGAHGAGLPPRRSRDDRSRGSGHEASTPTSALLALRPAPSTAGSTRPWRPSGATSSRSDLEPLLARAGFDGCVAVQARQTPEETRWLLELAERHPFIAAWWAGSTCGRRTRARSWRAWPQAHAWSGVRHIVQDEPDDRFLLRPDFCRGVAAAGRASAWPTTSSSIRATCRSCLEFVRRFPGAALRARPPGQAGHRGAASSADWERDLRALAALPERLAQALGARHRGRLERWTDGPDPPRTSTWRSSASGRRG